ncbi:DUF2845 domain-containing protein [Metapseudomonas resinovorans]|uniref:DUF2845 domain-containing protein n=1 Tax=Metapseudomonas resinovorans NBRC 106553 TaxID=1245471 RepID=S6AIW6_METRE|nr:DUF2845 domain-containing protein [Pseudomonas resinovorans]BAN50632.1 hypothetical protein PCA10_49000 [Pseudomonas resinovorans NBRC 106553]
MRALLPALLALALAIPAGVEAGGRTMRCGSRLISLGDRAFEVLDRCGEPVHRDRVGYTLGSYDRREFDVEEWVYGPTNGMLRILTFEGNRLVRIESRRSR